MGLIKSKACLMEKSTAPQGGVVEKSEGNFNSNVAVILEEAPKLNYTVF